MGRGREKGRGEEKGKKEIEGKRTRGIYSSAS